jgi:hypothetical protein
VTLPLAAHPLARVEFFQALDAVRGFWGLEREFLDETSRIAAAILVAPESRPLDPASPSGRNVRRAKIGRFPWNMIYVVRSDGTFVLAFAHKRRRPGYWRRRLR